MKGFFSKLKKNKKGYTLTELIVVVAILGVLALVAVPMVMNAVNDAKDSADKASMQAIGSAVDLCLAQGSLKFVEVSGSKKIRYENNAADGKGSNNVADIKDVIRNNLKGFVFPTHAKKDKVWKLDLTSAEISQVDKGANSTADSIVILDETP